MSARARCTAARALWRGRAPALIHLERPVDSQERDGDGFGQPYLYARGIAQPRLTPMAVDYDTVGAFYATLSAELRAFVDAHGEAASFSGDPALQLSQDEVALHGARPVLCAKTALAAFTAIVEQGEGAPADAANSHYQRFLAIRTELRALREVRADFDPAYPAATNPVLRRPLVAEGRVWIDDEAVARTVDLANTSYALMLRLLAYAYALPRPSAEKALVVDLGLGLMRAMTQLADHAARLPASERFPGVNAGITFSALRDAAPLAVGASARRFFVERFAELTDAARTLASSGAPRLTAALTLLENLQARALRGFARADQEPTLSASSPVAPRVNPPTPTISEGVEAIEGTHLTLLFEAKKCIHARFCVTGAPGVFLANVEGPWIHPDAMEVEGLAEIAHVCPSGAIRYRRKDGRPDEPAPPVNLLAIREAGPYALRGQLELDGTPIGYRATLCRCGASKNKPYCDGSHHDVAFGASGEPATGAADMLPVRDGLLAVEAEPNGPLAVRGNLEITSGTGRVVSRLTRARLCRCGGSANKPFCDGTHVRIGFRSEP